MFGILIIIDIFTRVLFYANKILYVFFSGSWYRVILVPDLVYLERGGIEHTRDSANITGPVAQPVIRAGLPQNTCRAKNQICESQILPSGSIRRNPNMGLRRGKAPCCNMLGNLQIQRGYNHKYKYKYKIQILASRWIRWSTRAKYKPKYGPWGLW